MAQHNQLFSKLPLIYHALAENYKASGDKVKYSETLERIIALKDSLYNINSSEALAEMQSRYDVQKRENVIIQQKFDLTKKNYFITGSLLLLLVVVITSYFFFMEYKKRQRIKTQVMLDEEKRISLQAVAEAEEAERKRIAADLHDNLGAQANAILYSTELLQQDAHEKGGLVTDLHHTAKDMLTSLRETLWVLKNTDATAADIWIRIINFSKQINRHYPSVKINADGAAPPHFRLTSSRTLNTVFIIQEAINNALRHSSAETILVNSEFSAALWKISITDNGKGFDPAAINKKQESYGLSNMKERALAADIDLSLKTGLNEGTAIQLLVTTEITNPKGVLPLNTA
jgi:signal transduction histidine kinase